MRKLHHSKRILNCLITAGPSYEELDDVRRLTNFSTGKLGCDLADFMARAGHKVKLLLGHYSTHRHPEEPVDLDIFTTGKNLNNLLVKEKKGAYHAVFHAAAVGDFRFGKVFARQKDGGLKVMTSGKFSTSDGPLLAELVPTTKILPVLRSIFPQTAIFDWKYEVEGTREAALLKGKHQIQACRSDGSIINGPAYGMGFGLVQKGRTNHFPNRERLFAALEKAVLQK